MAWPNKTPSIQEGGTAKNLTCSKLKTSKQGGGSMFWVPEEEVQLGTKSINKNGTYKASSDEKYGFSQVTVNVPGGSGSADSSGKPTGTTLPGGSGSAVVGTDPETGNEQVIGVDESGNLVSTPLPSSIVIVTNPTKMVYNEGDSIVLTGAVITAKNADGTTWTNADYPNGHVPIGEISVSPETATTTSTLSADVSLSWNRPGDGKVLTTTLTINVGPYLIDGNIPNSVNVSTVFGDPLHEEYGYIDSACPPTLLLSDEILRADLETSKSSYTYMYVIRVRQGAGGAGIYTYFVFSDGPVSIVYTKAGGAWGGWQDGVYNSDLYPYYDVTVTPSSTYNVYRNSGGGNPLTYSTSDGHGNYTYDSGDTYTINDVHWMMTNFGSSSATESNAGSGSGGGGTF